MLGKRLHPSARHTHTATSISNTDVLTRNNIANLVRGSITGNGTRVDAHGNVAVLAVDDNEFVVVGRKR